MAFLTFTDWRGISACKGSIYEKVAKLFELVRREVKEVAAEIFADSRQMLKTPGPHFPPGEDWT